ncbi:MAG TPA: hypothetical protein PKK06_16775 [Phycisphaerae bacterium]|nr:hypothetical protein [Phycisphaerae bacterium]HNU46842.1 hypothetical protein [Phycisphaerae bacterium]
MAKVQKGLMVPEDLYRLIQWQEREKGATFTRQAIAAFLAYFFAEGPAGPESCWMRWAVALEKGEMSIADVPLKFAEQQLLCAQARMTVQAETLPKGAQLPSRREYSVAQHRQWAWQQVFARGPNALDGLLDYWAEGMRNPDASPAASATPEEIAELPEGLRRKLGLLPESETEAPKG